MATTKKKKTRTLAQILKQRPALNAIKDVAEITDNNDQVWQYWIGRIGVEAVRKACADAKKDGRASFTAAHEYMAALVNVPAVA